MVHGPAYEPASRLHTSYVIWLVKTDAKDKRKYCCDAEPAGSDARRLEPFSLSAAEPRALANHRVVQSYRS